jgi:integrase
MATLFKVGENWYLNVSENGRRIKRSLGPNERLARLRLDEVRVNIERGKAGFPVAEKKTLAGRLERHLRNNASGKAPKTIQRYREMGSHFLEHFGAESDITPDGLREYVAHRIKSGARAKTINNELVFVRTVYGPRGTHPFRGIGNLPERDSKEIRYLVGDEPSRLLVACAGGVNRQQWPDLADYVAGYLYTGARLEELLALAWGDVGRGVVRVANLKTHGRKRGDKYRSVPIHEQLAPILERRRDSGLPSPFPPRHPNSLRRAISRAADRAGIAPGVGVHSLRHTFATTLRAAGVGLDVLARLLGHEDIKTTMIYARIQPDSLAGAVSLLRY